jgi:mRNA-degrading endonuclease RelE of RelBE toxin-antitoxin system
MEFRIADTFRESLGKLTAEEQKLAKTTAFDLQADPVSAGSSLHKLDNARDKSFWSARVGRDLRIIIHKTPGSFLLCYVDHHDKAYAWAERRKLEVHPKTGAAQWVEIRERVQEVIVPATKKAQREPTPLFANVAEEELLAYGVPQEWIADVQAVRDDDSLLAVADHLPAEASEALLQLAVGAKPAKAAPLPKEADPFQHPDALRRFRVMSSVEEFQRALDFPWEKWTVFLHPEQRQMVERQETGPVRVSGSAGTGKTIVALHRAVSLARKNPEARVLLTTFSEMLANALLDRRNLLVRGEPRLAERVDVLPLETIAQRLYRPRFGDPRLATPEVVRGYLREAARAALPHKFSDTFLWTEWEQIIDAWQVQSWEAYRDVPRLGRKTRLPESQRAALWKIFDAVRGRFAKEGLITPSAMLTQLAASLHETDKPPYEFIVVDEAQDLGVAHLRFVAALGVHRKDALFFAGDLGQRIFQQPFSWKALGVDVRGRSRTLRVNYRTSHQIRQQADHLLGREVTDVDGNAEQRGGTVSVFNGPPPEIQVARTQAEETNAVAKWLAEKHQEGYRPHELGVFVRSEAQLGRARGAVLGAALTCCVLDEHLAIKDGEVAVATMHLAKGLEFRGVVVMACDDEVIPLQERMESIGDEADLEEVYATERHLLYVACTRARDALLVTATAPGSEFLDDMRGK